MTISVKHTFQSAKGDPADTTLVRPTNWNAEHTLTAAAEVLLGRGVGAGALQEIPCSPLTRAALAATTAAAFLTALGLGAFSTGDVKFTLKSVADTGWVLANDGTIGDATSGATSRANADCADLYALLWDNVSNTYAAVSTGRGANAAADFAAHKTIALTKMLGRALAASGTGSGLTARSLGETAGAETVALAITNMPAHDHGGATSNPTTSPNLNPGGNLINITNTTQSGGNVLSGASETALLLPDHVHTITSQGSGTAHANMQPTSFLNVMVKL